MYTLLSIAKAHHASDLHITVGVRPKCRISGTLYEMDGFEKLTPAMTKELVESMLEPKQKATMEATGEVDFAYTDTRVGRFRVNAFHQRGSYAAVLRIVASDIPTPEALGIPEAVLGLTKKKRGLVLVTGPTGSGKTYLVKTLARLLKVPLAITDATSLTEAGYIGDDVESVLSKLLQAADNDVDRAEHGIVFIDEIDKIAKKQNTNSRDVSGESVQQGLLKLLEGAEVEVPVGATSKNAMVPLTTINTRNILFICGGAFPNLEGIIKKRLMKKTSIGFGADLKDRFDEEENIIAQVTNEDLREYGFIPEFIGRLPMIFTLEGLTKEMLVKILKEPKNAILKQYQKLLELDEVKLEFDEGALEAIAEQALKKKTGARALRAIIEKFMLDIMYEIPKDDTIGSVTITRDYIENHGNPEIHLRDQ